jgi:hypothetical protein
MTKIALDIIGKVFGRLTVLEADYKNKKLFCVCMCDCGKQTSVYYGHLKTGATRSCGCLRKEEFSDRLTKHGLSHTKIYRRYKGILERCYQPNHQSYKDYGGRGITVSEEWLNSNNNDGFTNFYNWSISSGYSENLTLDRINNDEGYSPLNCRWVTRAVQSENKRNTVRVKTKYGVLTFKELHDITNIPLATIRDRYYNGKDVLGLTKNE